MEGEAQPAAASSDEEEVEQGEMEIDWPFDHTTTMCIPDLRTMCELPANAENEGVSTFRALFLPKGKTVHVPGQPGCYVVNGEYRQQLALCLVHFVAATKRAPELLLAFSTFGVLDPNATGTFTISLGLPLRKSNNRYEDTPRLTKISDVAGFSKLDDKEQPWCKVLEPALARQPMYNEIKVKKQTDIIVWVRKTLEVRIELLVKRANTAIVGLTADVARQCKVDAEKLKAHLTGRLDKTEAMLKAMPPSAYDKQMDKRIFKLKDLLQPEHPWLQTPERAKLNEGEAVCISTVLAARRLDPGINMPGDAAVQPSPLAPAAVAATATIDAAVAAATATAEEEEEEEGEEEEVDTGSGVEEVEEQLKPAEPTVKGKRTRTPTDRLDPEPKQAKSKAKVRISLTLTRTLACLRSCRRSIAQAGPKEKPARKRRLSAEAEASKEAGINPRTDRPYVRGGAYNAAKSGSVAASIARTAAAAAKSAPAATTEEVSALKKQVKSLEEQLKTLSESKALAVKNAELEGANRCTELSLKRYIEGLAHGASLSAGNGLAGSPFTPS
jgi:hypothetical protein